MQRQTETQTECQKIFWTENARQNARKNPRICVRSKMQKTCPMEGNIFVTQQVADRMPHGTLIFLSCTMPGKMPDRISIMMECQNIYATVVFTRRKQSSGLKPPESNHQSNYEADVIKYISTPSPFTQK